MHYSGTAANRCYWFYGFASALLFSSIIGINFVGPELRDSIISEDGLVECLSAAGYFLCAILILVFWRKEAARHWQMIIVLVALGLRELDFNSRFTAMSVTKIRFFTSPDVPFPEKLVAACCGLLILYCLLHLLIRYGRSFLVSLKKLEPYALCIATGLGFLFASLALDGLGRKLTKAGFVIGNAWVQRAEYAEEILEFGIPLMFILGLGYFGAEYVSAALDRLRRYAPAPEEVEPAIPRLKEAWETVEDGPEVSDNDLIVPNVPEYRNQADPSKDIHLPRQT